MEKDFISINPGNGQGNGTVTIKVSANPYTSQRSTSIKVTSGGGFNEP